MSHEDIPLLGSRAELGLARTGSRRVLYGDVDDVFPPRDPLHRPGREVCVIPLSPAMQNMERCLERAVIVCVGGTRPAVTLAEVALAVEAERGLPQSSFSVHPFSSENCLIVCSTFANKERLLQGGSIKTGRFLLRQWSRLVQAVSRPLYFWVSISLEGFPIHAWSLASASTILSPSCWLESFDEASTSQVDLSAFRLVAWSLNPSDIPKEKLVVVAEPNVLPDGSVLDHGAQVFRQPSSPRKPREALSYNVVIHIHSVEDFTSLVVKDLHFAPSSDDSSFGGLPEADSENGSPRQHVFHVSAGIVDGSGFAKGREDTMGMQTEPREGRSRTWRLPPMSEDGPTASGLGMLATSWRWGLCIRQATRVLP